MKQFADGLKKNKFIWAERCVRQYLNGNCKSLDEAFGLKKKGRRGRKSKQRNDDIARKIYAMRTQKPPVSLNEIANDLGITDVRNMQRSYERRRVSLLAEGIELRHRTAHATALVRLARMKKRRRVANNR